LDRLWRW